MRRGVTIRRNVTPLPPTPLPLPPPLTSDDNTLPLKPMPALLRRMDRPPPDNTRDGATDSAVAPGAVAVVDAAPPAVDAHGVATVAEATDIWPRPWAAPLTCMTGSRPTWVVHADSHTRRHFTTYIKRQKAALMSRTMC